MQYIGKGKIYCFEELQNSLKVDEKKKRKRKRNKKKTKETRIKRERSVARKLTFVQMWLIY